MSLRIELKKTLAISFIVTYCASRLVFYSGATWNEYYGFFSMTPTVGNIDQILLALSSIIGVMLSFVCVKDYLKRSNRPRVAVALLCLYLVFCVFAFWLIDFLEKNQLSLLFVGNFTPLTLLFGGILVSGFDNNFTYYVSKLSKYVAIIFLFLSLYYTLQFYLSYGSVGIRYGNSHIMSFFIYGFYALTLFVFGNKEFGYCTNYKLIYALTILAFVLAIASVSRGWIIQTLALLLYTYIGKDKSGKKSQSRLMGKMIIVIVVVGLLVIVLIQIAPDIMSTLGGRLDEDTRSNQLQEFISQLDFEKVIWGQGYNATYIESAHGVYSYIDNQFLMMIFRYGLIPFIIYLALLVKSIWAFIKYRVGYGFASLMWFAALNGIAIYLGFGIDVHNFFIMVIIGRATALIGNKKSKYL